MNLEFKDKYLKYKKKFFELKKNTMTGGNDFVKEEEKANGHYKKIFKDNGSIWIYATMAVSVDEKTGEIKEVRKAIDALNNIISYASYGEMKSIEEFTKYWKDEKVKLLDEIKKNNEERVEDQNKLVEVRNELEKERKKFFKDKKKIIALSDKRDFLRETLEKRMRGVPNQDFYDEINQEIRKRISDLDNEFLNVNFVDILKGLENTKITFPRAILEGKAEFKIREAKWFKYFMKLVNNVNIYAVNKEAKEAGIDMYSEFGKKAKSDRREIAMNKLEYLHDSFRMYYIVGQLQVPMRVKEMV